MAPNFFALPKPETKKNSAIFYLKNVVVKLLSGFLASQKLRKFFFAEVSMQHHLSIPLPSLIPRQLFPVCKNFPEHYAVIDFFLPPS
jgi:hypothetical protein